MFSRFRNLSNWQFTKVLMLIFCVLMALPVAFAFGDEDPVTRLLTIAPIIALAFAAMAAGVVMVWIPEWLKSEK